MDSSTEQSVPAASSIRSWNAETFNNWFYDPQWQGNASLSHSFSVMNPVQLNLIFFKGKTLVQHLQKLGIMPQVHDCRKCRLPMRLYSHSGWANGCYWCCLRILPEKPKTPCQRSNSVLSDTWFSHSRYSLAELVISFETI